MAGGGIIVAQRQRANQYTGHFTRFTAVAILAAATTGLLLGYDNGVMGGVVTHKDFQEKFFYNSVYQHTVSPAASTSDKVTAAYCKYNDQLLQLTVSCLYLAAMVGALGSELARPYGRRIPIIFSGATFIVGAAIMACAVHISMIIIGRLILGLGVGVGSTVGPVYLSEMAPAKLRGRLNVLFQLLITVGILVAGCINLGAKDISPWGWRLPLAIAAVPGIIILIAGLILPESPSSLAETNNIDEARRVLQKARGVVDVEIELHDIVEAARQSRLIRNPYISIWKRKYRPQLFVALIFMLFQQFDGINAIIFYAPVLFEQLGGNGLGGLLNTVIIDIVNVLATFVAVAFMDKVGRRKLLIIASVWMFVTQIIVAGTLGAEFQKHGADLPRGVSISMLIIICIYICGHAYGWGPIGWLYPVEIQPLETRAAGAGINVAVNMLFTFIIGQCFTTMLCSMRWGVFLFFAGWLVIMGTTVFLFFPETANVPVENAHTVFQDHWFWPRAYPEIKEVHGGLPSVEMGKTGSAQMPDAGHPNPKSNGAAY
ncbi:g11467 [Coccomyxa viridis]|uniref:G11467 protein n=1 Tax=Coccomyxa viridis TaxID=1274662 RepID=A0ABP1G968_9CHLO